MRNGDSVVAEFSITRDSFDIYMFTFEDGKTYQVTNMEVDEVAPGNAPYSPQISLSRDKAQELFNDLWRAGIRPITKDDTDAKDEHIKDLRMIAFHALGMTK